jgi:hypothetical protein
MVRGVSGVSRGRFLTISTGSHCEEGATKKRQKESLGETEEITKKRQKETQRRDRRSHKEDRRQKESQRRDRSSHEERQTESLWERQKESQRGDRMSHKEETEGATGRDRRSHKEETN